MKEKIEIESFFSDKTKDIYDVVTEYPRHKL